MKTKSKVVLKEPKFVEKKCKDKNINLKQTKVPKKLKW